jgi:drug/metabolite transporter (DMT)-like permease
MAPRTLALLALFIVNLLYGINYVVAKGLMPAAIGPSGFILLRVLGAVVLFWGAWALRPERVRWSDALRLLLCAVTGVAMNQLMFFHGLMRTSALHASIIMVVTPILVLVMSAVLIGERVGPAKAGGVALGALGALALILSGGRDGQGSTVLGDLCILVNATSFAIYLVMVKPLMMRYGAVTVMAWTFLIGAVLVLPFGAGELLAVDWRGLSARELWAMAYVVVGVTFVAYLLNTWALRHVQPGVVGTFIYLQPVLAAMSTLMIGGAMPAGPWSWAAMAVIFLGVHLVTRRDAV